MIMWLSIILSSGGAILGAIVGALATAYFSSKSFTTKLAELDSKMYKIAEVVVERHKAELHQDSMYTYVEGEINKHHKRCGDEMEESLKAFGSVVGKLESKLQHMELKQTKTNIKLNIVTTIVSEIAKKMQITIDPTKISNGDDDE